MCVVVKRHLSNLKIPRELKLQYNQTTRYKTTFSDLKEKAPKFYYWSNQIHCATLNVISSLMQI